MEMAATIEDSPEFAPAGTDYNLNDPSDKELCPIDTEMGVTFHPLLVDQLRDHFPNYMEVCDTCFKSAVNLSVYVLFSKRISCN